MPERIVGMDDFDKELQAIFDRYNAKMDAMYIRMIIANVLAVIASLVLFGLYLSR